MGLFDFISQLGGGNADAPAHLAQLQTAAANLPPGLLAQGLAAAFRSEQTPAAGRMVSQLFGQSSGAQQAGMLNQLIASLGPAVAGQLAGGVLGRVMPPGGTQITPEQAQQLSTGDVQRIVDHAQDVRPGVVDALGSFYAEHAGLIKTLGGAALTVALVHLKDSQSHS